MKLARRRSREVGFHVGRAVAGYVVTRLVGPGVTGEFVYDAEAPDGREVMLVVGHGPHAALTNRARFRRLARLRAEVDHPALLPVVDWGERDGTPFFVTHPYPGSSLADLLRRGRVAPEEALALLRPVADALDVCHSRGLVHQLLTGRSILLGRNHALLDTFAIAAGDAVRTWEILAGEDLRYGTPEAIRGEPVEPASNVYSLTAILTHLLTGHAPHEGVNAASSHLAWAVGVLHLAEPAPRVTARLPRLSPAIDGVVAWGMAKDPAERPQSAGELLEAATQALADRPSRERRTPRVADQQRNGAPPRAGSRPAPVGAVRSMPAGSHAEGVPRRRRVASRLVRLVAIAAVAVVGLLAGAAVDPFGWDALDGGSTRSDAGAAAQRDAERAAVARLAGKRTALRSELATALTPQEQAAAATELSAAYDQAANAAPPGRLAGAARSAAGAYSDLADATESGDQAAFEEAADAVDAAESRFVASARR